MSSIVMQDVVKNYALGKTIVPALRGVSLAVAHGECAVVAGPSGSGKTTLLILIGCVDLASSGLVTVEGQLTSSLSEDQLTDLRLNTIGFIFQTFNLISVLNVVDNIEFPLLLMNRLAKAERRERVDYFMERVGLTRHKRHRPGELSGGQRQRVAIARALVTQPKLVLADEPTANLDSKTGESIISLLKGINESLGTTFVFSSHDPAVIAHARRVIRLQDGLITT